MRKYLLPENCNSYKANLHTHSNHSDGVCSVEEIKEYYASHGYSILAITDHDVFITHNELTDDNFLVLNGYEMEVTLPAAETPLASKAVKTCHMCLVATDPNMETPVCWHREKYIPPKSMASKDLVKFDPSIPDFERKYTHECISEMMKLGRENGFFVTYNHPVWSCEDFSDYIGYENMHAMEIMNNTCIRMGLPEYNDKIYDDILRSGKRIFCTATDDGHGKGSMCGCYIVVKAEKLEYKTVTDAMLKGNFYSSEGPEIRSLYIEDGKLTVETSDVAQICITTGSRVAKRFLADDMSTINSATYEIPLEKNPYYIRVTVIDSKGKRAYSNAYFLDEIL